MPLKLSLSGRALITMSKEPTSERFRNFVLGDVSANHLSLFFSAAGTRSPLCIEGGAGAISPLRS